MCVCVCFVVVHGPVGIWYENARVCSRIRVLEYTIVQINLARVFFNLETSQGCKVFHVGGMLRRDSIAPLLQWSVTVFMEIFCA